ncbi:MAG: serine/threonine-protein kinase, partial [Myxococcota bacterium]
MTSEPKVFKRLTESDILPEGEGTSERLRAADPYLGQTIDGRYLITERLGEGGMGAVYIAEHLKLGKLVALKTIHARFADEETVSERFSREAMAAGRLEHPHIASAMDYGTFEGGGAYLVMQLVRGPSVQHVLETQGGLGWVRAASIGAQIADALAAAADEGIVHRDLKPENVLLEDRDGAENARVLDFGVARMPDVLAPVDAHVKGLTMEGTVVGTPGYMAPEQALGEALDARADLYALGILLYEMTTGVALFDEEQLADIVRRQLSMRQTPRLREVSGDAGIPVVFQSLVDRLLAARPEDRPRNAREVR